MASKDKSEVLSLLRQHVKGTLTDYIAYTEQAYMQVTDGFINEDLKQLKKVMNSTDEQKKMLKKLFVSLRHCKRMNDYWAIFILEESNCR